jgi:1,4-dihydroxy-6-naphthoate synthase
MSIAFGKLKCQENLFSEIPNLVLSHKVDYGLIIHESQITFSDMGLNKIFDLGSWWSKKTNGLPVPLGINVASSRLLSPKQIIEFDSILKRSIEYGLENLEDAVEFSTKYGRNTSKDTLTRFIKMYVNDYTVDMKKDGKNSISTLFHLAKLNGILDKSPEILYSN